MKFKIVLLRVTGGICFLFMLFHCAFQNMFQWDTTLSCMSVDNRAIMLTYHYISVLVLAFMGVVATFQPGQLLASSLKYSVLGMFALFFILRIVTEFTLFGFIMPQSIVIIVMCAIPAIVFASSIFSKNK